MLKSIWQIFFYLLTNARARFYVKLNKKRAKYEIPNKEKRISPIL